METILSILETNQIPQIAAHNLTLQKSKQQIL